MTAGPGRPPRPVPREDCVPCGDTRQVEEAVARQSNEDRCLRLVEIAVYHTVAGDPENPTACAECGHPWPCATWVCATGIGDS